MKLSGFIVICILSMVFVSCKSSDETPMEEIPSDELTEYAVEDTLTPKSPTSEFVEFIWFSDVNWWNPPRTWITDENTVQGMITKNTGLTFKMDIPELDANIKLDLMIDNDALPDIISLVDVDAIKRLVDSGKVWKLEELLEQYDPKSHLLDDFPEDVKSIQKLHLGDWYSYPSHMYSKDLNKVYPPSSEYYEDLMTKLENYAIFFNGDLMEQAGISLEEIQTEEGVLAAFEKVKNLELKVNEKPVITLLTDIPQYTQPFFDDPTMRYLINTFGGMPIDPDGNYRDLLLAPETKHAMKFLNKTILNGYLDVSNLIIDYSLIEEYILEERVFCFIGNVANTGIDKTTTTNYVSPGAILSSDGKKPVVHIELQAKKGWMNTFVSKRCAYPEKAAKFYSYMSSREGLMTCFYGFEGVDYNLDENGLVIITEAGKDKVIRQSETGLYAYWTFFSISFNNNTLPALTEGGTFAQFNILTALGKDPETVIYDLTPFTQLSSCINPDSELGKVETHMIALRKEQIPKILLAENDAEFDEAYATLIAMMKENGIEELDAVRDEVFKASCESYGVTITSVNGE